MNPDSELKDGTAGRLAESLRAAQEDEFDAFATVTVARASRDAGRDGALYGDLFAVKECISVVGVVAGCGSPGFSDFVPSVDAVAVAQLESAGARLLGTTTMDELGCAVEPGMRRARNPMAPTRTASGSSGGSAAAVAAGIASFALGTDGAGSVRIPSAFCGVVGMKPTHGVVSMEGVLRLAPSLESVGVLAPRVRVAARVMKALTAAPSRPPRGSGRLAWVAPDSQTTAPVSDALASARRRLIAKLDVEEASLPGHQGWQETLNAIFGREAFESSKEWPERLASAGALARATILAGADVTDEALEEAIRWRGTFGEAIDAILGRNDAIMLPTVDHLAHTRQPTPAQAAYWGELRWTAPFNLSGHPAITIPIPNAVPVGLQLVGHRYGDHALLQIAEDVEAALGSHELS